MKLADLIKVTLLTDEQIKRKVTAAAKAYVKEKGWDQIHFRCIRGTYHFDNCNNYWVTAKDILEAATGLQFTALNNSMARISR